MQCESQSACVRAFQSGRISSQKRRCYCYETSVLKLRSVPCETPMANPSFNRMPPDKIGQSGTGPVPK